MPAIDSLIENTRIAAAADTGVELTAADALALVAEVTRLQRQRDEACADFDGLGPVIEGLEKAKTHIRADNEHLFQRLREEEALTVKWQQRAKRAEERLRQAGTVLAGAERDRAAAEAEAAGLREQLRLTEQVKAALAGKAMKYNLECDALRKRLATAEAGAALVPEAEWLEMVAMLLEGVEVTFCDQCPFVKEPCKLQCADTEMPRILAARIRAWRGDGDGSGDGNGEQKKE